MQSRHDKGHLVKLLFLTTMRLFEYDFVKRGSGGLTVIYSDRNGMSIG